MISVVKRRRTTVSLSTRHPELRGDDDVLAFHREEYQKV